MVRLGRVVSRYVPNIIMAPHLGTDGLWIPSMGKLCENDVDGLGIKPA